VIVNQWLPNAHVGDAMGDNARRVRGMLRDMGHESEVYAIHIEAELADDVLPLDHPKSRAGDVTIFHYGIQTPMTAEFQALSGRRVLQYHNVTPAEFFTRWDTNLSAAAARGRDELPALAGSVDLALGDSEFNRQELSAMGFKRTGVLPIAVDTSRVTAPVEMPGLEGVLDDGLTNFLFVGRIVPNKMIEDHVRLAAYYTRYVRHDGRFIFVGRCDILPQYYASIRGLISRLGLRPDRVVFVGAVPDEELAIYYQYADVYVSLSEHEGFCVPLVEAMAADVPVLAYAAAAVPDTLGGAGVQFSPKSLEYAGEMLAELAFNDDLRTQVIAGQRRRLADFGDARVSAELARLIGSLS